MTASAPAPSNPLAHATVVFVGHHQSGKSTAAGHILVKLGGVDKRALERVERETSNRPTSRFSWLLDKLRLERDQAMSMDLKICRVLLPPSYLPASESAPVLNNAQDNDHTHTAASTNISICDGGKEAGGTGLFSRNGAGRGSSPAVFEGLSLTLLDTPGHPDYLRNTIAGITQADVVVLVVDSRPAVLESPSASSQTRDLAHLATSLSNTRMLVVAVNHLDLVADAECVGQMEQRFRDCVEAVRRVIKRQVQTTTFVPCSALMGDNLTEPSPHLAGWWKGPTLVEVIAAAAAAAPAMAGTGGMVRGTALTAAGLPLRMPLIGVYKVGGIGTVAAGRVAGGSLSRETTALLLPPQSHPPSPSPPNHHQRDGANSSSSWGSAVAAAAALRYGRCGGAGGLVAAIRSIESFHESRCEAGPGEWVGLAVKGVASWRLRRGYVISDAADRPARLAARFAAKIQVLCDTTSLREGRPGSLRPGYTALVHVHTAQAPCRLVAINRCVRKGETVEAGADSLKEGDIAEVELQPLVPLVVEAFRDYPGLGRFAVRAAMRREGAAAAGGGGGGCSAVGGAVTSVILALGRVESVTYVEKPLEEAPEH